MYFSAPGLDDFALSKAFDKLENCEITMKRYCFVNTKEKLQIFCEPVTQVLCESDCIVRNKGVFYGNTFFGNTSVYYLSFSSGRASPFDNLYSIKNGHH